MQNLINNPKLREFFSNKFNLVLVLVLVIILAGAGWGISRILSSADNGPAGDEIELSFDPEGPYALLLPRRDGNALVLNIKRVSSYDEISYELVYQSDGIDRGAQGTLNTKEKKSEYTQEILFGTCSKGDTFSTLHCVFDKNVENGTLTLHIKKGHQAHRMTIAWHLQKPSDAPYGITSGDGHFAYKLASSEATITKKVEDVNLADLTVTGYTIVSELSGVPKLPKDKEVFGKVYALNIPTAKTLEPGDLSIELADNPGTDAKIAYYTDSKNDWQILDTQVDGSTLKAKAPGAGIFAVLVSPKK